MHLSAGSIVLVAVVSLFTAAAALWDLRYRRIPNKLTLPVFIAGWVYQGVFHQWAGLADGALGFALGFGMLFVLWMIGGGGGGDVKLMGALSVWLGFHLTLLVVIVSTVLVLLGTLGYLMWAMFNGGFRKAADKHLGTNQDPPKRGKKRKPETTEQRQQRRVMAYAIPVALATWLVLIWKLPTLP